MPDRAARRVLDAWIDRLRPVEEEYRLAAWEAACRATEAGRAALVAAEEALERRLADPLGHQRVQQSLEERIDDPLLRRALACLAERLAQGPVPRADRVRGLEAEPFDAGGEPDPFRSSDPVALVQRSFEAVGLDIRPALLRSDLEPREGKAAGAFCTHIDRRGDVRVFASVVSSTRWVRTLLGEFARAAYYLHLDFDLPWILVRPAHACVADGVALLFESLVDDPAWRKEVAGVVQDPGPTHGERPGQAVASQLDRYVRRHFEAPWFANPEVGRWLADAVFAPGAALPWDELLEGLREE